MPAPRRRTPRAPVPCAAASLSSAAAAPRRPCAERRPVTSPTSLSATSRRTCRRVPPGAVPLTPPHPAAASPKCLQATLRTGLYGKADETVPPTSAGYGEAEGGGGSLRRGVYAAIRELDAGALSASAFRDRILALGIQPTFAVDKLLTGACVRAGRWALVKARDSAPLPRARVRRLHDERKGRLWALRARL